MAETKKHGCEGEGACRSDSTCVRGSDSSEKERLSAYQLSDGSSNAFPQTQGSITTYERGNPSRKRNPNQEREVEAKKPRILMLFGVKIIIPDEADQGSSITHVHQNPSRNPNSHREEDEDDQGSKITHVHQNPSRNPYSHQEEEEEAHHPGLIPQQRFRPRIFEEGIEQHSIFLFEKELQCSDVLPNHNRLLITGSYRLMNALTEEERRKVEGDNLRVMARDANNGSVVYMLHLKKWAGSGGIILKREWSKFVAANKLQKGDTIEGWGYRIGTEFRLALSVIRNKSK